ncbi:MAG: alcohol dehydrogenase catalytic domain-containing protein [Candidatus Ranarchaeia archaeon]
MFAWVKEKKGPKAVLKKNWPEPKIGRDDVLCEVIGSSICGTDVHIWEWDNWAANRIKKIPLIQGHELAGKVIEVGADVTRVQEGDLISAETHIVDNTCYQCRTNNRHICRNMEIFGVDTDGVFAEYVALPAQNAWINDPNYDPHLMAIQEPLGNAVHSVIPPGSLEDVAGANVLVLGDGPTGLLSVAVLREMGAGKIFGVGGGYNKTRINLMKPLGADYVFSAKEHGGKIVKEILDLTDGNGCDVVLEMSGASIALKQGLELLTPGGRMSILGVYNNNIEIDVTDQIVFKSAKIFGITGRRMYETWYQLKGLLRKNAFKEKVMKIITHKVDIKDLPSGFDLILNNEAGKVALNPVWE